MQTGSNGSGVSLGDEKWWDVFQDEQLRALIRTALQQNYDVRIAGTRILAAQAQLGITRADQFPRVAGGASFGDERTARTGAFRAFESGVGQLNITAAWELDFWGKFRRATEAARANLLASEAARQEVIVTLVANVSAAYFQLRALDLELEISQRTLGSRRESLRLTQLLADGGSTSMLDVRQAEQLVFTAAAEIPALEQQIEQQENLISILLGKNPDSVARGQKLTEQPRPLDVPPGLTSSLLERRPDIRDRGTAIDRSECRNRSCAGRLFSPNLIEWDRWVSKRRAYQSFQRPRRCLDLWGFAYATYFHGRANPFQRTFRGSSAARSPALL